MKYYQNICKLKKSNFLWRKCHLLVALELSERGVFTVDSRYAPREGIGTVLKVGGGCICRWVSKKVSALERWKSVHQVFTGKGYSHDRGSTFSSTQCFLLLFSEKKIEKKSKRIYRTKCKKQNANPQNKTEKQKEVTLFDSLGLQLVFSHPKWTQELTTNYLSSHCKSARDSHGNESEPLCSQQHNSACPQFKFLAFKKLCNTKWLFLTIKYSMALFVYSGVYNNRLHSRAKQQIVWHVTKWNNKLFFHLFTFIYTLS